MIINKSRTCIGLILACIILVLSLSVSTEADENPILTVDSVALVHPGDSTTVNLSVSNLSQGIYMLQLAVEYDAEKLQLTSVAAGDVFSTAGDPTINETIPGIIYFNWDSTSKQISGDCILLSMTFTAITEGPCDTVVKVSETEDCILANWEEEYIPVLADGTVHIEKEWVVLRSLAANFAGKIGLNYYLLLPDYVRNDPGAYVLFTAPNGTKKQMISEGIPRPVNGELRYCYIYNIVAYEIRDIINIKVYDGNDEPISLKNKKGTIDYTLSGVDYSFLEYCEYLEQNGKELMKPLAAAAIDYCTSAQFYFNHNVTDQLSLRLDHIDTVTMDQLNQYKPTVSGNLPNGVGLSSITALFDSDNSFRLYLVYDADVDPYTSYTYTVDSENVDLRKKGEKYYIGFDNVASNDLDEVHEIGIADNMNSFLVNYSVLSYARAIVKSGTDDAAIHLGKALYLYNVAANNYFNSVNNQ